MLSFFVASMPCLLSGRSSLLVCSRYVACCLCLHVFCLGAYLLYVRARLHALFVCLLACQVFCLGAHLLFVRARLHALFHCLLACHVFCLGAHLFLSVRVRLHVAFVCISLVWALIFCLCALGSMLCLFASISRYLYVKPPA